MGGLADRIRYALANPLRDDHAIDPMRELADLLREVGLEPESGGGAHLAGRPRALYWSEISGAGRNKP
jgi:hypothetical protein